MTLARLPAGLVARTTLPSPLGAVTAAATARGVALLWFAPLPAALSARDLGAVPEAPSQRWLAQLAREWTAYWAADGAAGGTARGAADATADAADGSAHGRGPVPSFSVPLDLQGTPFQRAVWEALRALPPGQTCSYTDVAARIGRPSAVRAVAAAIGANPVGVVVPCHRVVGRNGRLTGYAAGLDRKRALLGHEGAPCRRTDPAPS